MLRYRSAIASLSAHLLLSYCSYSNISKNNIKHVKNDLLVISNSPNEIVYSIDPAFFKDYEDVKCLEICNTSLSKFPENIGVMKSLRKIEYTFNEYTSDFQHLFDLPDEFKDQIEEIIIWKGIFKEIPEKLFEFKNLKHLRLQSTLTEIIPESIDKLSNLQTLSLSNNLISKLPESIGNLQNLTVLDLNANLLSEIPVSCIKLQKLKKFIANSNRFSTIPLPVLFLQNLTVLECNKNQKLASLFLPDDKIQDFFAEIRENSELNKFIDTNKDISLQYLPSLTNLECHNSFLTDIPDKISCFRNLIEINFSNNRISKISPAVFKLLHLKHLTLSLNKIRAIPKLEPTLAQSNHIKELRISLSENYIQPEDIQDGYGTESLKTIFCNCKITEQGPPLFTFEEEVKRYYEMNKVHWIIEKLREINEDSKIMLEEAKNISDTTMVRMWKLVLQYFVFKSDFSYPVEWIKIDENDVETNELINKVLESEVFKKLKKSDENMESFTNLDKVLEFTSYLDIHNCELNDIDDNENNKIIKSCIKLVFKQILQEILQIPNRKTEIDAISAKVISLCAINETGNRCLTGQMEAALSCYLIYYKQSSIILANSIERFLSEKLATLKNIRFLSAVLEENDQNTHDSVKWKHIFHKSLGITCFFEDPLAEYTSLPDEFEIAKMFVHFTKLFSVNYAAEETANAINSNKKLIKELHTYLSDNNTVKKAAEQFKKEVDDYIYIHNYVTKEFFKYGTPDLNGFIEPISVTREGIVKVYVLLGIAQIKE